MVSPTQFLEMLKQSRRSHFDERGFDKVDLDLATEATLLLLRIAGVQAEKCVCCGRVTPWP